MNWLRIIVIGNSVAMRIRPPSQFPVNKNYSMLLQNLLENELDNSLVQVDNMATGGSLVRDVVRDIDVYVNKFPQYYILNVGVNDASTREIPHWFNKYVNSPIKNNFEYLCSGLHANIFKKHRPFFVKLRGHKSWVSEYDFAEQFELLIATLLKETNARIISLPINPANDRVEKQLPGSYEKHLKYNENIKNITSKYNQIFIDTTTFIKKQDYPDGVHYSKTGHELIAAQLKELIISELKPIQQ